MSKTSLCAWLSCVVLTSSAWAAPSLTVTRLPGHYSGSGGEFEVTPNSELEALLGHGGSFGSFCMEKTEYIDMGVAYDVQLGTEAILGGSNHEPAGPGGGDVLDPRTAYLYSHFAAGTLTGYDYTPGDGRASSAGALQDVIWYLEDEAGMTWIPGSLQDTFYTAAQNAVDSGSWTGLGNVRVMNLYAVGHAGDYNYLHQDLLATIPAPGALLLTALGTPLVGLLRRRRTL